MIDDAARVRVIRAILGITMREFAKRVGVRPMSISDWEKGRSRPQSQFRDRMALIAQEHKIGFTPSGMPIPFADVVIFKESQNA